MDGSPPDAPTKDRPFDPSRTPATAGARQLVSDVLARVDLANQRKRRRRAADQERYERLLAALVCDLAHRHLFHENAWLSIEMAKSALSPGKRRAPFMTEKLPDLVSSLAHPKLGLADFQKGFRSPFGGMRSTLRAGSWLRQRIEDLELTSGDLGRDPELLGDPLQLKSTKFNGKSRLLNVPETAEVVLLRSEMRRVNAWIGQAELSWAWDEVGDGVDVGKRFLTRIFNNGSLTLGGRLYHGFWIDLPKEDRLDFLRIDRCSVAALDFAQMSVRMAYGMIGAVPPAGDLYAIHGWKDCREGVKRVLNALLANNEPLRRLPAGTRKLFPRRAKFDHILAQISARHPLLVPLFGTAKALEFMYRESQVLLQAMEELRDQGVVALPVHDCLLVAGHHADSAKAAMEKAFLRISGIDGKVDVEGPRPVLYG